MREQETWASEGDKLVLDTEDEIAVLMDYCLHDVRRHGVNAVEEYIGKFPSAPESDESILLQALRLSRHSLFAVEATEPGVGVHVRDLLRDEPLFLVDVGFSQSASVGMVLATRVTAPEGICMTTGAALPVGVLSPTKRAQFLDALRTTDKGMDFGKLSPDVKGELAATTIRTCLQKGAAKKIAYLEPDEANRPGRHAPQSLPPVRPIGRNDSCPCGSGKKFKRCCRVRET